MEGRIDLSLLDAVAKSNPALVSDKPQTSGTQEPQDSQDQGPIIGEVKSIQDFNFKQKTVTSEPDGVKVEDPKDGLQLNQPEGNLTDDQEDQGTENPENTENTEYSPVKALAEWAGEKGILPYDPEKFEDSEDYLKGLIEETAGTKAKEQIESYKDSLPAAVKEIIENFEDGVPLDALIYSKSREMEYKSIDPEKIKTDTQLQKDLIVDYLALQEYTEAEIQDKITRMESAGILDAEASDAHKKLMRYQEKYQQDLKAEAEQKKAADKAKFEQALRDIKNTVDTKEEILPGVKLTKDQRQKLFEGYTKLDSKGQTELMRKMAADPLANLKIAQLFLLYNGDLSQLEAGIKTKLARNTKQTVNTYKESTLGKLDTEAMKRTLDRIKRARQG